MPSILILKKAWNDSDMDLCSFCKWQYRPAMGSKTKWYFWPNAFIRESIGMIVYTKLSIGTIFAGLVLCFAFVELMILR